LKSTSAFKTPVITQKFAPISRRNLNSIGCEYIDEQPERQVTQKVAIFGFSHRGPRSQGDRDLNGPPDIKRPSAERPTPPGRRGWPGRRAAFPPSGSCRARRQRASPQQRRTRIGTPRPCRPVVWSLPARDVHPRAKYPPAEHGHGERSHQGAEEVHGASDGADL